MYVSPEILTTIVSAATLLFGVLGTMAAGMAWVVRRVDRVEERLGERIDRAGTELGARFDGVQHELDGVQREVGEVKIAVARLEGPERRLIAAR